MKPEEVLKKMESYMDNLDKARRMAVKVGLPSGKIGEKAYKPKGDGDGISLMRNAAIHEYGYDPIPQRSFLRVPFSVKRKELSNFIAGQFEQVFVKGKDAEKALGQIGAMATNISKQAFVTKGYGKWPDITEQTKQRKGKSTPLIDSGLLRQSITWEVTNDS